MVPKHTFLKTISAVKSKYLATEKQKGIWFITVVVIVSICGQVYNKRKNEQYKIDLLNGNAVPVNATVTTIWGKQPSVYVKFIYEGRQYFGEFYVKHFDSIEDNTVVRILISKLHPDEGIKYIGVDTVATKAKGIKLYHDRNPYR